MCEGENFISTQRHQYMSDGLNNLYDPGYMQSAMNTRLTVADEHRYSLRYFDET